MSKAALRYYQYKLRYFRRHLNVFLWYFSLWLLLWATRKYPAPLHRMPRPKMPAMRIAGPFCARNSGISQMTNNAFQVYAYYYGDMASCSAAEYWRWTLLLRLCLIYTAWEMARAIYKENFTPPVIDYRFEVSRRALRRRAYSDAITGIIHIVRHYYATTLYVYFSASSSYGAAAKARPAGRYSIDFSSLFSYASAMR